MKTSYIISAVVIVLIAGGVWWYMGQSTVVPATYQQNTAQTPPTDQPSQPNTPSQNAPTTQAPAPSPSSAPASQSFTVNGNDASADVTTITVPKGTSVTITFGADAKETYHGGLDFRSSVVNTGTIVPGGTKTIQFTATQSFAFTPYWPSTNIAKPYKINVIVQ